MTGCLLPLRRFLRDRRAVGAVEFALIAPILLLLYVSGSELAMAVTMNRKVQQVGATVNDLITQSSSISKTEIDSIFAISSAILSPYSSQPMRIRVSSIDIDAQGKATVECSRAYDRNASPVQAIAKGKPFTLPEDFATLRSRKLLVTETRYDYVPLGGYGIKAIVGGGGGLMKMGEVSYLNPRIGNAVACSDWYS